MVEARTLMATAEDVDSGKRKLFVDLKKEFPELPEVVIWEKLRKYPTNPQLCIRELHEESNRYLYGGGEETTDSPWPVNPPAPAPATEALSISIPNSTVHYNRQFAPRPPVIQPVTSAFPTSSATTTVAGGTVTRQPLASYRQVLLQHQQQRLHNLAKELANEKNKLEIMRITVKAGGQEIIDRKFRVGGNPSMADVQHLQDENKVLTDEINEMTQEIDQQGLELFDEPKEPENPYATSPATLVHVPTSGSTNHPPPPYPRTISCPAAPPPHNDQPQSLCGVLSMLRPSMPSPATEELPPSEGLRDRSLENQDWVLVQQNHIAQVAEQNWTCRMCTFENHPALDTCEICNHRKHELTAGGPWRANIQ